MHVYPKNCLLLLAIVCLVTLIYITLNDVSAANTSLVKSFSENDRSSDNFVDCANEHAEQMFRARGNFWVFYNFVKASESFACYETVTYTTHADYTFLGNVEALVDRWDAPVSIAIYAPGEDFEVALKSIAYLRKCKTQKIEKYVTFHLFFDNEHFPNSNLLAQAYKDEYDCDLSAPYARDKSETYRIKNKLLYPINVARNIARLTATTYFVFPSDIELYTVYHFPKRFLKMMRQYPEYLNRTKPSVFVLPIFEITENSTVPNTKTELLKMLKTHTAQTFHAKLCSGCHKIPYLTEWMAAKEYDGLKVFKVTKRTGRHKHWEPFYVGTQKEPLFDERITWEGQSNKITQAYSMCLLDYEFLVLDNVFLIHKPGIKKSKEQIKKYSKVVSKTNSLIRNVIKPQLKHLYGDREGCAL